MGMERIQHNFIDDLVGQFDQALKTLVPGSTTANRDNPASKHAENELNENDRAHAAGLMRINHTGEVCAQALYQGQALTAKLPEVRSSMDEAAQEEIDHLNWCESRLNDLDSRTSFLNPLWYTMSFGIGAAAGLAGDKWSLGFVAETESQVCEHLKDHLVELPENDLKSQAILKQMLIDEGEHAVNAKAAGAAELPSPLKHGMTFMSQVMKKTVYKI
jgi:3-demethoxyubiquinol 3-hydroxylase